MSLRLRKRVSSAYKVKHHIINNGNGSSNGHDIKSNKSKVVAIIVWIIMELWLYL
jgi:hypothetical protein